MAVEMGERSTSAAEAAPSREASRLASQSPSKMNSLITADMIASLRQRARDEPGPPPNMDKEGLQALVDKYTAAADEDGQREVDDDGYSTKQQDKEASGPDGVDQYELARTQVAKVAKTALPDNVILRKDVLAGLIKASTVFINYLAAAAHEKTSEAGIKTLGAQHVLAAFKELNFPEEYYKSLKRDYNERAKAEMAGKTSKDADAIAADGEANAEDMDVDEANGAEESIAVGEETLAAADAEKEDDDEGKEENDAEDRRE